MPNEPSSFSDEIRRGDPARIGRLFDLNASKSPAPEELQAILRYELTKPVPLSLWDQTSGNAAAVRHRAEAYELVLKSLSDLLRHAHPPLPLLASLKDFAKSHQLSDGHVPPEVARLLYFAAIAVALLRHGEMLSTLSEDELRKGLTWAAQQEWSEDWLKELFQQATRNITS